MLYSPWGRKELDTTERLSRSLPSQSQGARTQKVLEGLAPGTAGCRSTSPLLPSRFLPRPQAWPDGELSPPCHVIGSERWNSTRTIGVAPGVLLACLQKGVLSSAGLGARRM